jgi:hypothetical protein
LQLPDGATSSDRAFMWTVCRPGEPPERSVYRVRYPRNEKHVTIGNMCLA